VTGPRDMDIAQVLAAVGGRSRPQAPRASVEALYAAGYWLLERERVAEAAKVFRVMLHAEPRDERAWLGLGECHERAGQPLVALELYGAGGVVAESRVRCLLARARVLRALERSAEADDALSEAQQRLAVEDDDGELTALVECFQREGA